MAPCFVGLVNADQVAKSGVPWAYPLRTSSHLAQAGKRMMTAPGMVPGYGGLLDLHDVDARRPSCWAYLDRKAPPRSENQAPLLSPAAALVAASPGRHRHGRPRKPPASFVQD